MNNNKNKKKTILIDLDGVLNDYRGNFQENNIPNLREGADIFLQELSSQYTIKIFTTRPQNLVKLWVEKNNISKHIVEITNIKEPAFLIIDDRCIKFDGDYESILKNISNFTPWYKKDLKSTL